MKEGLGFKYLKIKIIYIINFSVDANAIFIRTSIQKNEIMIKTKNTIIGAGPGGLAVAGRLAKLGEDFEIIEMAEAVAPAWRNHYDRLHLHTAKELSALPHLPYPESYPLYVPREQVVEYMTNYAKHFGMNPHFGEKVISVKQDNNLWITTTDSGKVFQSENVIVATGFNRVPNVPTWKGIENYQGFLQHSKFYKNGSALKGKQVLLVGMGNTGAELSIDLHEHGAKPYISARNPVNIVRRDINGKPTQYTAIKLQKLPNWLYDFIAVNLQKITVGDLSKYGLKRPIMPPSKQLRELGKTPVIDLGTVDLIKKGIVKILPAIQEFKSNSVVFENGKEIDFDAVILATGYKSQIEDFVENISDVLNHLGEPKAPVIIERKGLFFIGFGAYAGGILRSINMNSELIVNAM
jgi:cation diffusion facilitator CzcD-associated flavoprotein CzcO